MMRLYRKNSKVPYLGVVLSAAIFALIVGVFLIYLNSLSSIPEVNQKNHRTGHSPSFDQLLCYRRCLSAKCRISGGELRRFD